jgi:hypothetical protein
MTAPKPPRKPKRIVVWAVVDHGGTVRETTTDGLRARLLAPLYDESAFAHRMTRSKGQPGKGCAIPCYGVLK